ncbi:MAG: diguanylate cyclase domain-containing protein, partial [Acidimicrobiaceae bacterium]
MTGQGLQKVCEGTRLDSAGSSKHREWLVAGALLEFALLQLCLVRLPNRVLFLRKLSEALDRSRTLKRGVTVLFVDLDKLKDVNDTIG